MTQSYFLLYILHVLPGGGLACSKHVKGIYDLQVFRRNVLCTVAGFSCSVICVPSKSNAAL